MPRRPRATDSQAHDGQVLIILAVSMVVLLGFLAAAVDVGLLLAQRRGAQNAVDAAALAVADAVYSGVTSTTTLDAMAAYYVQQNGVGETPTVTLSLSGSPQQVSVDVTHAVSKAFLGAIDAGPWQVHAHAVAALEPVPKDYALLALDTSGGYPVNLTGNVNINVVGGGAMSNSGMQCTGNDSLTADLTVDAHTGFRKTGNCGFSGTQGSTPNAPVVPDPLAGVPPPPAPSVPTTQTVAACTQSGPAGSKSWTCPPGQHTQSLSVVGNGNSITFQAGNHELVNSSVSTTGNSNPIFFNPGTYYLQNSSITLTGNNTTMQFAPGTYNFYVSGGSVTFTGNNSGYVGNGTQVNFYFKNSNVTFTGNTTTYFPPGIYYFDNSNLSMTGNSTIVGQNVFFYFVNGAGWSSTGNTSYSFTASSTALYPGMQPHLLIYSDRGNTGSFSMTGNAGTLLDGIIYLPDTRLTMTGNASGTWARGQLIVKDLTATGNANVQVDYQDYVQVNVPAVYLIQ